MPRLVDFLTELEADAATGRVTVRSGNVRGWVYLTDGQVYCAERNDRPTVLVALADAGLFDPDSWTAALRAAPGRARWDSLVAADHRDEVRRFVRAYVSDVLTSLDSMGGIEVAFGVGIGHPFGAVDNWPVRELIDSVESMADDQRMELTDLLLEASPLVRLVNGRVG